MAMANRDETLIGEIFEAIDANRVNWVRDKLNAHPHLINADLPSCGWLGSSVTLGFREMTEMLIEIGCDVNIDDGFGSLLEVAVTADQPELLSLLMDHGAKFTPNDRPALIACSKDKAVELLRVLSQNGVDLFNVYTNENTGEDISLAIRAALGRDDVVEFLQSCGYACDAEAASGSDNLPKSGDTGFDSPAFVQARLKRQAAIEAHPSMRYLVYVEDEEEDEHGDATYTLNSGPVAIADANYLREAVALMKPLTDEQYMSGPAVLPHFMAKFSYVLDGETIFWCIEWDPGLIVLRVPLEGTFSWVALRSPIPDFGGREPIPVDREPSEYGFENNPQYNLVFDAWDAQSETEARERGFAQADDETHTIFEAAMLRLNEFEADLESQFGEHYDSWLYQGKRNLAQWCGTGLRL